MFWSELAAGYEYVVHRDPAGLIDGYAGLMVVADEAQVQTIGVRPDAQGRGLGRALLRHLMQVAGQRRVLLEVRTDNVKALALYDSEGFVRSAPGAGTTSRAAPTPTRWRIPDERARMSTHGRRDRLGPGAIVLGIESSCDETGVGLVRITDGAPELLGQSLASSQDEHARFGGVVPRSPPVRTWKR